MARSSNQGAHCGAPPRGAKRGIPMGLQICSSASISKSAYGGRVYPEFILSDPENWHSTCRSLLERHTRGGQDLDRVARDLGVDAATSEYIVAAADRLVPLNSGNTRVRSILLPRTKRVRLRANRIGRAIYLRSREGISARMFVRNAVLLHASRCMDRSLLEIAPHSGDMNCSRRAWDEAKTLAFFVKALEIADLTIGLVCDDTSSAVTAGVAQVLDVLELPGNTPVRFREVRKAHLRSTPKIGIEVLWRIAECEGELDGAFQSSVALAKVVEPWLFSASAPDSPRPAVSEDADRSRPSPAPQPA